MLDYLLSCSTLKLGSNPGALDNRIGYLDLQARMTLLKSTVKSSLHSYPSTTLTSWYAIGLNLSGLNILISMRLISCFPKGEASDLILGILSSGLALFMKSSHEC
jgi:hypothetical protein